MSFMRIVLSSEFFSIDLLSSSVAKLSSVNSSLEMIVIALSISDNSGKLPSTPISL